MTTALFFRPGGQSTQHAGVASDIVVPSIFGTDEFGEAHQTYSLPTQSITAFIDPSALPSDSPSEGGPSWKPITPALIQELALRSQKRVEINEDLIKVRERIAKSDARNGVVHLAELMKEKEEEAAEEEAAEAEKEAEASNEGDGDETPTDSAEESEEDTGTSLASADKDTAAGAEDGSPTLGENESEEETDSVAAAEADEEDEPSPQQLEAVLILADLIQLTS